MIEWHDTQKARPKTTKIQRLHGLPVLIWPHYEEPGTSPTPFAYFGTRYGNGTRPVFYIYGRQVWPTHWAYLPEGPSENAGESHE